MTFRKILLGLLVLLLGVATAPAQVMQIHTDDGETASFNLADVDSITFAEEGEGPQAGDEREFQLTDDVTVTMVWIPSGEFEMGSPNDEDGRQVSEGPVHSVQFENGFWVGKHEVIQAQWEAVMGDNPAHDYGIGDNHPVYYVSWDDIQEFEAELDNNFRLPSESEWEYACRAGTNTRFYWGDDPDYEDIGDYAVYSENNPDGTTDVGTKLPNAWGLYDMSGNVWEWCEDRWHTDYDDAPDDGSPWLENSEGGTIRIWRGAGFLYYPWFCRSAQRYATSPSFRDYHIGFRLVRDAD